MNSTPLGKFCINCIYCKELEDQFYCCYDYIDMVRGIVDVEEMIKAEVLCADERCFGGCCGREGSRYTAANPIDNNESGDN